MSVKEKALQDALRTLNALGCAYKVITTDGHEHGDLEVVVPKQRTRTLKYPVGTYSTYIKPHLEHLSVGDVAVIPVGEFDAADLQGAVTSTAHNLWGKRSYKTCVNGKSVELLRIA